MPDAPEFHHLAVFARVIEERSVSGGARAVGLSQPTVSGHLATIEKALGTRLFDRVEGEIRPTQAGEVLYRHAIDLIRRRRDALEEIAALRGLAGGVLDVGGSNIPGVYVLPRLIAEFQTAHPGVRVQLRVGDSAQMAELVADGALDLAVIGSEPTRGPLLGRELGADRLTLVVPPDHPWAGKRKLDPKELAAAPFIMRERGSGSRALVERALTAAGVEPESLQVIAELGSNEAVKQSVIAGLGVSVVSERSVANELTHGLLGRSALRDVSFERPFYLVTDRRRSASPMRRAFEAFLVENVRD